MLYPKSEAYNSIACLIHLLAAFGIWQKQSNGTLEKWQDYMMGIY